MLNIQNELKVEIKDYTTQTTVGLLNYMIKFRKQFCI